MTRFAQLSLVDGCAARSAKLAKPRSSFSIANRSYRAREEPAVVAAGEATGDGVFNRRRWSTGLPVNPAQGGRRDGGVLESHAGQVADRDLFVGRAAHLLTDDDLSELCVDRGALRVTELAEGLALGQTVADDQVGAQEAIGVEFLFAGRIGSYGGNVDPGPQPVAADEWFARGGGGDKHLGRASDISRAIRGFDVESFRTHIGDVLLESLPRRTPGDDSSK